MNTNKEKLKARIEELRAKKYEMLHSPFSTRKQLSDAQRQLCEAVREYKAMG